MSIITVIYMLIFVLLYQFYKRYFALFGLRANTSLSFQKGDTTILDVRDYIDAHNCPCEDALNIPLPYLKRNFKTIPFNKVFVIAENKVSVNLSSRLLQKSGFEVVGFYIVQDQGQRDMNICKAI